ncbi:unnamed protein product [Cuscuta europaea]|uniref:Retrovirus-related Pol polyprotein from transposon TNT 1-94-like beta-barrel domain-containing protein n=1 Tax=Cuscuta europaea TaxID=41803 RepID=A0A9P0YJF7_CUSEU|nr:unnamed protein product [Cuscuta europaea]
MRSQEEYNPAQAFVGHLQQPAQPQPGGVQPQQGAGQQPQGVGQQQPVGGQAPRGRGQRGGRGGRGQRGGRGGRGQRGRGYGQYQPGHGYAPHFGYGDPPPGYFPGGAPHGGILGAPGLAGHPASKCPSHYVQPAAPALAAQAPDASDMVWYPNSGVSAHMTPHSVILSNKSFSLNSHSIVVANRTTLLVKHTGQVTLSSSPRPLHLKYVLHVPHIKYNLLSIQKLCADNNYAVIFDKNHFLRI